MADGSRPHKPPVRVSVPQVRDYAYIADRLRPDEREQFVAFTGMDGYNPNVAARAWILTGGLAYTLIDRDDRPFALGWFEQIRPGVWETSGIGTPDGWAQHWYAITRECRRRMAYLFENGAHRIQIVALASRTQAHGWYERGLQMQFEGTLRGFCANGADAVIYARLKGDAHGRRR